jgi:hypothetical protein
MMSFPRHTMELENHHAMEWENFDDVVATRFTFPRACAHSMFLLKQKRMPAAGLPRTRPNFANQATGSLNTPPHQQGPECAVRPKAPTSLAQT